MKKIQAYTLAMLSLSILTSSTHAMLSGNALQTGSDPRRVTRALTDAPSAAASSSVARYTPDEYALTEDEDMDAALCAPIDDQLMGRMDAFFESLDKPLLPKTNGRPVNERLARILTLRRTLNEKVKELNTFNAAFVSYIETRWTRVQSDLEAMLEIGRRIRPSFFAHLFQKSFPNVLFEKDEDVFTVATREQWMRLPYYEFQPQTDHEKPLFEAIQQYQHTGGAFDYRSPAGKGIYFYGGFREILDKEMNSICDLRCLILSILDSREILGPSANNAVEEYPHYVALLRNAKTVAQRISTLYPLINRRRANQDTRNPDIKRLEGMVDTAIRQLPPAPLQARPSAARRALPAAAPVLPAARPASAHSVTSTVPSASTSPVVQLPYTVISPTPSSAITSPTPSDSGTAPAVLSPVPFAAAAAAPSSSIHRPQPRSGELLERARGLAPAILSAIQNLPVEESTYDGPEGSSNRQMARRIAAVLKDAELNQGVKNTPMDLRGMPLKLKAFEILEAQSQLPPLAIGKHPLQAAEELFNRPSSRAASSSSNRS